MLNCNRSQVAGRGNSSLRPSSEAPNAQVYGRAVGFPRDRRGLSVIIVRSRRVAPGRYDSSKMLIRDSTAGPRVHGHLMLSLVHKVAPDWIQWFGSHANLMLARNGRELSNTKSWQALIKG